MMWAQLPQLVRGPLGHSFKDISKLELIEFGPEMDCAQRKHPHDWIPGPPGTRIWKLEQLDREKPWGPHRLIPELVTCTAAIGEPENLGRIVTV
ncbi:hypothetical protein CRG98_009250 [Punica granatum]|uniref:Uncharacterized protein n=1 Tax=Punica granatum TaxID=22663 RepID=A0A2I0KPU7_PUNGR|nr:hypothetical protein CRG98_009250 [Punica granatum]